MDQYAQSHTKALAINHAYHDLQFRSIFCSLKGYDYHYFDKHKTEYFFFLLNTSSKNQDEQKEIQSHLNKLKKEQANVMLSIQNSPEEINKIQEEILEEDVGERLRRELEDLGGGKENLGEEYMKKYLES